MTRFLRLIIAIAAVASMNGTAAFAHAFLDHAVPGVGMTVTGSPGELRFYFTQGVVTAFSGVQVVSDSGASIPCGKPVNDPSDPSVITVRLGHALGPGTYKVSWRVLSVDTHTTSGTFRFTVS